MSGNILPTLQNEALPGKPKSRPINALAVTGFVISFFCGIAGMIMCIIARIQIKSRGMKEHGLGFATAGIWVSIGSTITTILYIMAEAA